MSCRAILICTGLLSMCSLPSFCAIGEAAGEYDPDMLVNDDECSRNDRVAPDECSLYALQKQAKRATALGDQTDKVFEQQLLDKSNSMDTVITSQPCSSTNINFRFGSDMSESAVFALPDGGNDGYEIDEPCTTFASATDAPFRSGAVTFTCRNGTWKYARNTCAACAAMPYSLSFSHHNGSWDLPRASHDGQLWRVSCEFDGGKSVSPGQITFACRNGSWLLQDIGCAACVATNYSINYSGSLGVFKLPATQDKRTTIVLPCSDSFPHLKYGMISFGCTSHGWDYKSNTCKAKDPVYAKQQHAWYLPSSWWPR